MQIISIDFQKTMRQADRLEECAANLRNMKNREYSGAMRNISTNWISDSSAAFLNKGELLGEDIEATARDLETIANNIRRSARRIYEAERRAEELARRRQATR